MAAQNIIIQVREPESLCSVTSVCNQSFIHPFIHSFSSILILPTFSKENDGGWKTVTEQINKIIPTLIILIK